MMPNVPLRIVVVAWSGLVVFLGCGEAPPPQEEPAPVVAPASAAPPVVSSPALPPPPPARHDTLELRDPGAEPRVALAVPVIVGTPQRLVAAAAVRNETARRRRGLPRAIAEFDTTVRAVGSDGSKARDLERMAVRVVAETAEEKAVASALAGHVRDLLLRGGGVTQNPFEVARLAGLEPTQGDLAPARTLAGALALGLSHLSIPVPSAAVGVGAKWTIVRSLPFFGVPAWQTLDCTLVGLDGSQLEIRAVVAFTLEATPTHDLPLPFEAVASGAGKAELLARIERPAATPIEMWLRGKVDVQGAALEPERATVGFDLRIDEDYLARPDPRVQLAGRLTAGGLVRGTIDPAAEVWLGKKRLPLSDRGDFVFGLAHDAPARQVLALRWPERPPERHVVHLEPRVLPALATDASAPPASAADPPQDVRIRREAQRAASRQEKRIRAALQKRSDDPHYARGFGLPVQAAITVPYGAKPVRSRDRMPTAVAFAAGKRTRVRAPGAGVVLLAEQSSPDAAWVVVLDHGHGLVTTLRGLQAVSVDAGDLVRRGHGLGTARDDEALIWSLHWLGTPLDPVLALELGTSIVAE